jgi:hypothetical protein
MRDMLQRTGRLCTAGTEEEKALLWRMQLLRLLHCEVLCSGAFAKLRKSTICLVMSVCPSVRMEHLGSQWKDFHEIRYLSIFRKSVEKIQVSLKSDNNNGTVHHNQYTLLFISRLILLRMTDVWQTAVEKFRTHILCTLTFSINCAVCKIMWKQYGTARQATKWRVQWPVLLTQCFSGGQITKNEMGRERSMYRAREMKSAYRVFIVKPEGNRWLGRPRHRWEVQ